MKSKLAAISVISVALSVALTACSKDGAQTEASSSSSSMIETTTVETSTTNTDTALPSSDTAPTTATSVASPSAQANAAPELYKPKEGCEQLHPEYQERWGFASRGVAETDYESFLYHYFVHLGEYDPCAESGYVWLNGAFGNEDGPGGTGASIHDALIFYKHGEIIGGKGYIVPGVKRVNVLSRSVLSVTIGRRAGTTAEGVNEFATVTLRLDDDKIVPINGDIELFNKILDDGVGLIP